jgi:hypothetical protein
VHQQLHRAVPDGDAQAQGELGMHPPRPVGAAGGQVDRLDLLGSAIRLRAATSSA